jgi:hypothetical protein
MRSRTISGKKKLRRPNLRYAKLITEEQLEKDHNNQSADNYFNELAEMVNQPVNDIVYYSEENEPIPQELFDEILGLIPAEELQALRKSKKHQNEDEMNAEIDRLSKELRLLTQRYNTHNTKGQLDDNRMTAHLNHIILLVKQFSIWSSAKKNYSKIINNAYLSKYDKVQLLIETANSNLQKYEQNKKAFFIKHLTNKSANIHKSIASIDMNADTTLSLTQKSTSALLKS